MSDQDDKITSLAEAMGRYLRAQIAYAAAKAEWENEHGGSFIVLAERLVGEAYVENAELNAQFGQVILSLHKDSVRSTDEDRNRLHQVDQLRQDASNRQKNALQDLNRSFVEHLGDLYEDLFDSHNALGSGLKILDETSNKELHLPSFGPEWQRPFWYFDLLESAVRDRKDAAKSRS